jgi:DNA-binding response OmpR family regulator
MTDERRILLIDDNDDHCGQLARALRSRGWTVEIALNAKQGHDAAGRVQPELVISELILPDIRGFNFARSLRSMVEHDLVVIGLTRISEELHTRALAAGFDLVKRKPCSADALHEHMVSMTLDRAS